VLVPEKREERTTEGGIDAAAQHNHLKPFVRRLGDAGIRVSMFVDPDVRQLEASNRWARRSWSCAPAPIAKQ
jgi:pyridoxine 5-phosphate synthase